MGLESSFKREGEGEKERGKGEGKRKLGNLKSTHNWELGGAKEGVGRLVPFLDSIKFKGSPIELKRRLVPFLDSIKSKLWDATHKEVIPFHNLSSFLGLGKLWRGREVGGCGVEGSGGGGKEEGREGLPHSGDACPFGGRGGGDRGMDNFIRSLLHKGAPRSFAHGRMLGGEKKGKFHLKLLALRSGKQEKETKSKV